MPPFHAVMAADAGCWLTARQGLCLDMLEFLPTRSLHAELEPPRASILRGRARRLAAQSRAVRAIAQCHSCCALLVKADTEPIAMGFILCQVVIRLHCRNVRGMGNIFMVSFGKLNMPPKW